MVKPITPGEAEKQRITAIPDFVLDAVNFLLVQNLKSGHATILQKNIVEEAMKRAPEGFNRNDLFDKNMMDFEAVYRKAGWKVDYDKPGYNESYEASFAFTKKKSR